MPASEEELPERAAEEGKGGAKGENIATSALKTTRTPCQGFVRRFCPLLLSPAGNLSAVHWQSDVCPRPAQPLLLCSAVLLGL